MNERTPRDEPSTEEILESIRQAVAEGAAAGETTDAEASAGGDRGPSPNVDEGATEILELTQEIREDGSVVDTETGESLAGTSPDRPETDLVGENAETASAAAFAALAESVAELKSLHEDRGGKTIEEAAKEIMRPMIRDWLDANLPGVVERLVQREIERMSRQGETTAGR